MAILRSQVVKGSDAFKSNVQGHLSMLDEVCHAAERAAAGGTASARGRHIARGKLLPRDRVCQLLDPGSPFLVHARKGDLVERGDPLLGMEAMKMAQTFTAPRRAVVADILVENGSQVSEGAILLTFEPEEN